MSSIFKIILVTSVANLSADEVTRLGWITFSSNMLVTSP